MSGSLFKVVWTDGFGRETIAERVIAENIGEADAHAMCNLLRAESISEGDWWVVKPQDAHVWRGMGELI